MDLLSGQGNTMMPVDDYNCIVQVERRKPAEEDREPIAISRVLGD